MMNTLRIAAIGFGLLSVPAAFAHTELAATVPANSAMLETAPESIQLRFSEAVRLTALTLQLDGAARRSLGPLPAETTTDFSVTLPQLANGHYVVTWRALSEDTHVMNGEFMFAIGADGSHDAHMEHDVATAGGETHDDHAAH
jgi:copper transport protein